MNEIDKEMADLLQQLDDDKEEAQITEQLTNEPDSNTVQPVVVDEVDNVLNIKATTTEDGEELVLKPVDIRDLGELNNISGAEAAVVTPVQPAIDVSKYHTQLDAVTDEVLRACRADRQETQDVINLFRSQIDAAISKNIDPGRMWVDALIQAVEVKANINSTAVKIMEANAKMLAATKSSISILNQNVQTSVQDLNEILDQPLSSDDEF